MICSLYNLNDSEARARYGTLWERTRGVFTSLRYADAANVAFGLNSKICFDGDDAALLMYLKGSGIFRRIVVPPCTQYSGLLLRNTPPSHLIHRRKSPLDRLLLCAEQVSRRADLLIPLDDPRTAQWRGWQVRPLFTYLIDLSTTSPERWSSGAQRTWKSKASRYKFIEDAQYTSQVIALCASSYKRHGRSLPTQPSALNAITEAMGDWARIFIVAQGNKPEAGIIILHDEHTAHYWIAGSIPGPAMTILIGNVLPILSDAGITMFDFVGANTPSIAEFKRSFGPVLTQYYHLRRRPRIYIRR